MTSSSSQIPPARAAALRAEGPHALRDATRCLREAFPYRNRDPRARIAARCNLNTLRDLRALGVGEES